MRFADGIRKYSEEFCRWELAYKYLSERSQENLDKSGVPLIRGVLLPEGRPLLAGIGTTLMILGTALLFFMPVMGVITIVGALMVLFTVKAPDSESIKGWHIVRALAIVIIIGFLAGGTWSPPIWWWAVAITIGSALFVGFVVLWVGKGFPDIYASFVHACSRLCAAPLHHIYRRRARRARDKMIGAEKALEQVEKQCSIEIRHSKSVYRDAYISGVRYSALVSRRNGQGKPTAYFVAEDHR